MLTRRHATARFAAALSILPRLVFILLLLASPLAAIETVHADGGATIEAPVAKKKGAGLVLLITLQRA